MAVQCLILSSGLKDYGHLLALASYRKAPIGAGHAFCLTPTDEASHSATIVVLCFAIVCVYMRVCVRAKGLSRGLRWSCLLSPPWLQKGAQCRPLLSGWLILYQGGWVGGSEAKKKFVYLKSTSKFGPL